MMTQRDEGQKKGEKMKSSYGVTQKKILFALVDGCSAPVFAPNTAMELKGTLKFVCTANILMMEVRICSVCWLC